MLWLKLLRMPKRKLSNKNLVTQEKDSPRYPHPLECKFWPESENQNDIAALIKSYQTEGHIKRCAHLDIKAVGEYGNKFWPKCRKDSFKSEDVSSQKSRFYGCPKDCHFYEPQWKAKATKTCQNFYRDSRNNIIGISVWFSSLAPTVQVILAIALLALFSSPWSNTILEIVKILLQK